MCLWQEPGQHTHFFSPAGQSKFCNRIDPIHRIGSFVQAIPMQRRYGISSYSVLSTLCVLKHIMSYNLMTMFLLLVPATGSSFLIVPLTPAGMVSPQYLNDSSGTEAVMYQVQSYYTIMHIPSIDDTTHEAPENGPVETQNFLIPSKEYLKKYSVFRRTQGMASVRMKKVRT